jgi:S1-C subfamily serine protease
MLRINSAWALGITAASLVLQLNVRAETGLALWSPDALGDKGLTGQGAMELPGPGALDAMHDPAIPPATSVKALTALSPENVHALRGTKSVQLYRKVSPAVVLIATDQGIGSGTLLNAQGDILTNWHVVGGSLSVGVIFKPKQEGHKITRADLRPAKVIRVDEVADLALVRVSLVPDRVDPVALGEPTEIVVGTDVHAIGHPTGEAWTYTMGVISQVRQSYKWRTEDRREHEASVIQTQTPINPGNSGGPLLTDDGRLIGVNSFKAAGEGLNFAVGLDELRRFLSSTSNRVAAITSPPKRSKEAPAKCEPKTLYSGVRKAEGYVATGVDLDCDGRVDVEFRMPLDQKQPLMAAFDRNADGKIDLLVFSFKRDYHDTGDIVATRYEPYSVWKARTGSLSSR